MVRCVDRRGHRTIEGNRRTSLTHAWDHFEAQSYEQVIVSPKGGLSPLEPRALKVESAASLTGGMR
jgi:hypothetical protein